MIPQTASQIAESIWCSILIWHSYYNLLYNFSLTSSYVEILLSTLLPPSPSPPSPISQKNLDKQEEIDHIKYPPLRIIRKQFQQVSSEKEEDTGDEWQAKKVGRKIGKETREVISTRRENDGITGIIQQILSPRKKISLKKALIIQVDNKQNLLAQK